MTKLFQTINICLTLFMARTFGTYRHSGWNGEFEYARYRWKGEDWIFPTDHAVVIMMKRWGG